MELEYERVGILIASMGFYSKLDILMIYARPLEQHDKDRWNTFSKALENIRGAYTLRNTHVHAVWNPRELPLDPQVSVLRTKGGKLTASNEPVTESQLAHAAHTIWAAGENFSSLLIKWGVLQSSQEQPRGPSP